MRYTQPEKQREEGSTYYRHMEGIQEVGRYEFGKNVQWY